ncbi:hypothetical protein P7K49_008491 [Saguinus oedipus]|uniref:5'-nucleotidase domain-containing protein 1 n=1 Tax=Saguinus oedipus TaxID=9490 RepID=A0ABQ9VYM7_SAGOE|nr:hypothetical protein P7K49_008491 [Saguinus oedipus]
MAQHFSLAACDVVGFDLDHTLCRYNLPESAPRRGLELAGEEVEKRAVTQRSYNKSQDLEVSNSTRNCWVQAKGGKLKEKTVEKSVGAASWRAKNLLHKKCQIVQCVLLNTAQANLDHCFAQVQVYPTLAKEHFELIYNSFAQFLVKEKGYDKELLNVTPEDWDFCCKGLALDLEDGNFLKLADNGTVLRASHGTKMMTPAVLAEAYGKKEWKHFLSDTGMACRSGMTRRRQLHHPLPVEVEAFNIYSVRVWVQKHCKQPGPLNSSRLNKPLCVHTADVQPKFNSQVTLASCIVGENQ